MEGFRLFVREIIRSEDGSEHYVAVRNVAGAGTDRKSFEADRSLTYQEAASSINQEKEELSHVANTEKRSLTKGGLIEGLNGRDARKCLTGIADLLGCECSH